MKAIIIFNYRSVESNTEFNDRRCPYDRWRTSEWRRTEGTYAFTSRIE